mmetsp:Transcript_10316/g.31044  ORF Transcript_10316/g.31044 Transcript_10316/m.31044 type:complete len:122 (-) Transcript_10316:1875-2240(-)
MVADATAANDNGGGIILATLAVLWAPTVIILISFFGLLQFKLLFSSLAVIASNRKGGWVWGKVQPLLSDLVNSLEASLGPASKFTPTLTHILLVGVAVTLLVTSERTRVLSAPRTKAASSK